MIRLNAFFGVNEDANLEQIKCLSDELVEKSRQEKGIISSVVQPILQFICSVKVGITKRSWMYIPFHSYCKTL